MEDKEAERRAKAARRLAPYASSPQCQAWTLDLQPDATILPDDMLHSLQHTEVVAPMYWPSRSPRGFVPAKIQRAMQLSRVDAGRQEGRLGLGGDPFHDLRDQGDGRRGEGGIGDCLGGLDGDAACHIGGGQGPELGDQLREEGGARGDGCAAVGKARDASSCDDRHHNDKASHASSCEDDGISCHDDRLRGGHCGGDERDPSSGLCASDASRVVPADPGAGQSDVCHNVEGGHDAPARLDAPESDAENRRPQATQGPVAANNVIGVGGQTYGSFGDERTPRDDHGQRDAALFFGIRNKPAENKQQSRPAAGPPSRSAAGLGGASRRARSRNIAMRRSITLHVEEPVTVAISLPAADGSTGNVSGRSRNAGPQLLASAGAMGRRHGVCVYGQGAASPRVLIWGENSMMHLPLKQAGWHTWPVDMTRTLPPGCAEIVKVACGAYHTLLLSSDGRVLTFGNNSYGQLGLGLAKSPVLEEGGPGAHTASSWDASAADGREDKSLFEGFRLPVSSSVARPRYVERMRRREGDGRMPRVVAVAAGDWHSLCLSEDGLVLAWGTHAEGQLGVGTKCDAFSERPLAVSLPAGLIAVEVRAGHKHSAVLALPELALADAPCAARRGRVFTWGVGSSGQLGCGHSTSASKVPLEVTQLANKCVSRLVCGPAWTLAVTLKAAAMEARAAGGRVATGLLRQSLTHSTWQKIRMRRYRWNCKFQSFW